MSAQRDPSGQEIEIEVDFGAEAEDELKPVGGDGVKAPTPQRDERLEADQRDEEEEDDDDEPGLTDEQRRNKRTRKRAELRRRNKELVVALEAELNKHREMLAQLQQQVAQQTTTTVEAQYRAAVEHVRRAETAMKDAVERGDGDRHIEAMRYRDEALTKARELGVHVQRMREGGQARPPQQLQPDPELVRRATEWASKHNWYNPAGADVDSQVVQAIDNEVARAGFDPRTTDYWEELTDRLKEKLPHRFKVAERKAPAISGRGEATVVSGKRTMKISPEFRQTLEEAGIWDDPKRRNKALADHFRILNER